MAKKDSKVLAITATTGGWTFLLFYIFNNTVVIFFHFNHSGGFTVISHCDFNLQ